MVGLLQDLPAVVILEGHCGTASSSSSNHIVLYWYHEVEPSSRRKTRSAATGEGTRKA